MRDLFLNKVILHGSFLSIDEQGAIASAATTAIMALKGAKGKESLISFMPTTPFSTSSSI